MPEHTPVSAIAQQFTQNVRVQEKVAEPPKVHKIPEPVHHEPVQLDDIQEEPVQQVPEEPEQLYENVYQPQEVAEPTSIQPDVVSEQELIEQLRNDNEAVEDVEEQFVLSPENPGVTAIALYDYQAAADDEISFDPDDLITHIDMIDAGWWKGLHAKTYTYGLFPANYVQLRE